MHKPYRIGLHALLQMQRRHIINDMIEDTMAAPDSIMVGEYGRKIYQKLIVHEDSSKLIRLVVESNGLDHQEIVTLYLTSKIRKYMGEH